jgi:hypothetical protein
MRITYSKKYKLNVIESFGFKSKDGKLVDKTTDKPVIDNLGSEISFKKFAGIRKGSIEIIGKDTPSLINLVKTIKK